MDTMNTFRHLTIGAQAPLFTLPALDDKQYALVEARGRPLVLNFWSAECPWAERADRALLAYLNELDHRVALWTVAANANEPPDMLQRVAAERGLPLVLRDADCQVAELYSAQTTPHLFLIDAQGDLRYQGSLDDVTFRQRTPRRNYMQEALLALLSGRSPNPAETPPYGCTIVRRLP